jgi:hypothetical protein
MDQMWEIFCSPRAAREYQRKHRVLDKIIPVEIRPLPAKKKGKVKRGK